MTEQQRKNLLAKYMEGLQLSENELVQTLSHVICLKKIREIFQNFYLTNNRKYAIINWRFGIVSQP